ncbi:MAG: hypothetical protein UU24_C0040G0003 [Candidatus Nomurabacteria bacterium GW2011_GWA2_40_9]|uniref:Uncharacterized protein n=1 Tax=Candidatus Nomurabacteria bacterium GW2011_GWA2_40_9 TaxID=1618734 RepID=A0A0G0WS66_9BACT|nr:MAG: hypothetical protein UU24_C0040G0003 [Candidatus Nomurabacteria bacterium GW2011_GWA2_40_9]
MKNIGTLQPNIIEKVIEKKEIFLDLDITEVFNSLEKVDYKKIFKELIGESTNKILQTKTKEELLNNLWRAKESDFDDKYFSDIRKVFLIITNRAYFLSKISKDDYAIIKNYTSLLGDLKDNKKWNEKYNKLITSYNILMEKVGNLDPSDLKESRVKYERKLKTFLAVMEKDDDKFLEEDYHKARRLIRSFGYLIKVLGEKITSQKYIDIGKKYKQINTELGYIRDKNKTTSWKAQIEKYFKN